MIQLRGTIIEQRKEQIRITEELTQMSIKKKLTDIFESIFHLIPKVIFVGNNHPFPSNSLRFPVHTCRANKACFSLESHTGPVLAQKLNIIHN